MHPRCMHFTFKKLTFAITVLLTFVCLFIFWELFIPYSLSATPPQNYMVQKGLGDEEIAADLQKQGIIKNSLFFRLYVFVTGQDKKLQAGNYELSSSMSVYDIVKKFVSGDVIKNYITIIEGWDQKDIAQYFESKSLYAEQDFLAATTKDFSDVFGFLKDKPKKLSLEGYLFPDTYEVSLAAEPEDMVKNMLANFDKKLTSDIENEITRQNRSIFQVITMASILEKEVQTVEDKKIVAGILWKRIKNGMPLQVDASINYITGKHAAGASIKDTKIDSLYNTYKYAGLPLGPISNPGMDSILAAIYPVDSPYWYYLSADNTGKTIFSKTLEEHNSAKAKYLK